MEKYWICFFLLSLAAANAQQGDDSYELYADYAPEVDKKEQPSPDGQDWKKEEWQDYEDYPLYDALGVINNEEDKDGKEDKDSKEEFDQIEDNRSEQNADESGEINADGEINYFEGKSKSIETENSEESPAEKDENADESDEKNADGDINYYEDKLKTTKAEIYKEIAAEKDENAEGEVAVEKIELEDDQNEDDNVDVPADEKELDDNDEDSVYMDEQSSSKEADNSREEKEKVNVEEVQIENKENGEIDSEENDDNSDENDDDTIDKYAEEAAKDISASSKVDSINADTVDKVYKDLNEDLEKLMETRKKLNDDNSDYVEPEKNADDDMDADQISKYEDKYGVPYGEKYVLSLREQSYDDADNEEKMSDEVDDDDEDENSQVENKDAADTNKDEDDGLFKDDPEADEATSEELDEDDTDAVDADDDTLIEAGEDGILNDSDEAKNSKEVVEEIALPFERVEKEKIDASSTTEIPTTIDVSNLSRDQYDELMRQFKLAHADSFDLTKLNVGRDAAPVHITLTQEPLEVTSPNFPSPYPTNNIIDWVFSGEGKGMGVELIITDFYVNGIMGDYLLVVPGGVDDTSKEGLVFTHMLNEERRYRFLDVDKMFVRFQSMPGFSFRQGFRFTVRLVAPLSEEDTSSNEALPEAEPLLPEPAETFTVLIGGLTLPQFNESVEQFRHLIADMATMYINANAIEPGLNTTRQVTQITGVAVCNLNWPNSDVCSEVTFAVPLVYDDEDAKPRLTEGELRAMWYLYSVQDPFALRLRNMGMEEFMSPNDSGVLTVWLVVGFALLISMAMLAFALWRFSCFENYARMPTYSDRDSVYSKQGLDLYPTPHQTLPPLFADAEYKWDDAKFEDTSRADMGGFSNKSYIRDELLDIDSDDEVIPPNKRDSGYQARGFEE